MSGVGDKNGAYEDNIKSRYFVFEEKKAEQPQLVKKSSQISHLWNISPIDEGSVSDKIAKQGRARKVDQCSKLNVTHRNPLFCVDNYWM